MEVKSQSKMEFSMTFTVSEEEARALNALTVYGFKSFTEVFYEKLGVTYMKPHHKGLESLFETIKKNIPPHLARMSNTRKTFNSNL